MALGAKAIPFLLMSFSPFYFRAMLFAFCALPC